jgi:hypothetical protein
VKGIFFDFEVASDAYLPHFRRPLLTEKEREGMSEVLTMAVSPRAVTPYLNKIDAECDAALNSIKVSISEGPFGAFKIIQDPATATGDVLNLTEHPETVNLESDLAVTSMSGTLTPRTQMLFHSLLELSEEGSALSSCQVESAIDGSGRIHEVFDASDLNLDYHVFRQQSTLPDIGLDFLFDIPNRNDHVDQLNPTNMRLSTGTNTVPDDAVYLIRHYSTTVLALLTPFRHSESHWHVLFVLHTKSCLAALTLGETLDHASLCAFYATLFISAFSLGKRHNAAPHVARSRQHVPRHRP